MTGWKNLNLAESKWFAPAVYVLIALTAALSYRYTLGLMAIQSPWFNTIMGRASASTILLLVLWVYFVESWSKKRKWSSRKTWGFLLGGVMVLAMSVQYTPL